MKLMNLICGGYPMEDFEAYLSYNDFIEKKDEFDVLGDLFRAQQIKFRTNRCEESEMSFRSLMLMVYLEDCMGKLSRFRIEEIMAKNKVVW